MIYGYVDDLGYLRCALCASAIGKETGHPVTGAPHSCEACDRCHKPLNVADMARLSNAMSNKLTS
jgi:hypothetical protein